MINIVKNWLKNNWKSILGFCAGILIWVLIKENILNLSYPIWGYLVFGGIEYDGSGDYTDITSILSDIAFATSGSISMLIYKDDDANSVSFSISRNVDGIRTEFFVEFLTLGRPVCLVMVDGVAQWTIVGATGITTAGSWHHVVITHDGTAPLMYVNNVDVTSFSVSTDKTKWWKAILTDATNKADVGTIGNFRSNGGFLEDFDGQITEVGIGISVPSQSQIELLSLSHVKKMPKQAQPDLKGYWPMADGVPGVSANGVTIKDESGNENHGTGVNGIFRGEEVLSYVGGVISIITFAAAVAGIAPRRRRIEEY